jgi:hypothetical protein
LIDSHRYFCAPLRDELHPGLSDGLIIAAIFW